MHSVPPHTAALQLQPPPWDFLHLPVACNPCSGPANKIARLVPHELLQVLGKRLRLSGDFDFGEIARLTPGFVGADLAALTQEAAALAVRRVFAALEGPGELPGDGADVVSAQCRAAESWFNGMGQLTTM